MPITLMNDMAPVSPDASHFRFGDALSFFKHYLLVNFTAAELQDETMLNRINLLLDILNLCYANNGELIYIDSNQNRSSIIDQVASDNNLAISQLYELIAGIEYKPTSMSEFERLIVSFIKVQH